MPTRRLLLVAALGLLLARVVQAGERRVASVGGVAIRGYDPVAYFTRGQAVQGSPDLAVKWKGALWYFASEETRLAFEMDPRRYAPQFGGHCAMSLASGQLQPGAPEVWAIHAGRLYLFASPAGRDSWALDAAGSHALAESNWSSAADQ